MATPITPPDIQTLGELAIDLLRRCAPGKSLQVDTTCGNTIVRIQVRNDHAPIPNPQPEKG
jgi:hypothetical protein